MERRRKFRKKNAYSHIIVAADYLGPLRCWRCKIEQDQSQFKPLKYYVPVRKGYAVKMYVPACHKCRTDKKSKWFDNPLYTAKVEEYLNHMRSRQAAAAVYRGIAFMLDTDYLVDMYLKQKGKCALSGIDMMLEMGTIGARNWYTASIDRIDSNGNYVDGNVQLTCAGVNMIKSEMSQPQFIKFCQMVVAHQADMMDDLESAILLKTA